VLIYRERTLMKKVSEVGKEANRMNVDEFAAKFIDGYLASDLDTMSKSTRGAGMDYGDMGYPMVLTTLAGIELLGALLLPITKTFDPANGRRHFLLFWDDYLVNHFPVYGGFGDLFYSLLRNGVAHTYTAKHGVYVTKGSGAPLKYDTAERRVTIDSNVFAEDFLSVYRENILPIISDVEEASDPSAKSMQKHLDKMMELYEKNSEDEFRRLRPSQVSLENAANPLNRVVAIKDSPVAGFSGPLGAIAPKPTTTISGISAPDS
jgi:hypothetical protein